MAKLIELLIVLIKEYRLSVMASIPITIILMHKLPHWVNEIAETTMIFFSCLIILIVIEKIYKKYNHYRNIKKAFRLLTPQEKAVLKLYISQETNSLSLDIMDAVLAGLVIKGFVVKSTKMSYSTHFGHTIQPWAWEYMQKHKDYFTGSVRISV